MKLSLRCVQEAVSSMLAEPGTKLPDGGDSPTYFPYPLTAFEIRRRLSLLEKFRADVWDRDYIQSEWEKPITEALGTDFWKTVSDWMPPLKSIIAIQLGTIAVERHEVYGSELPLPPPTAEQYAKFLDNHELTKKEMVTKLIALEAQHLALALRRAERDEKNPAEQRDMRLDLFLRYRTTASRAFYRALSEYRKAAAETTVGLTDVLSSISSASQNS